MLMYAKYALKKKKRKTLLSHEIFEKVMPLDTMSWNLHGKANEKPRVWREY